MPVSTIDVMSDLDWIGRDLYACTFRGGKWNENLVGLWPLVPGREDSSRQQTASIMANGSYRTYYHVFSK
jgi:hypothetical protein